MSSAEGLFAMRNSGASRASACLAGSSEGNGLSVTAIRGWAMMLLHARVARSGRKNLRIDTVGRLPPIEDRQDIVDHDIRHLLAHLDHAAAEMRRERHIWHLEQRGRHLGLVLEHVEAGAGDRAL